MGFYSVEVLLEDAKRHGIGVQPLHVNRSQAEWVMEAPASSLRVPFQRLKGLGDPLAEAIVADRRARGPYTSLWDFVRRVRPARRIAERLIRAGALDGLPASAREPSDPAPFAERPGTDRRDLLWALGEMRWDAGPLDLPPVVLTAPVPRTSRADEVAADYALLGLAQNEHLLALYRPQLSELGVVPSGRFETLAHGERAKVAGRIEIVQRPGPAKGIAFVSLEDEEGLINLLCYPKVYEQYRHALRASPIVLGEGKVQRQKGTLHLIVERLVPIDIRSGAPGVEPSDIPGPAKEYQ
jgi:error-prone DNA polymerase